MNEKLRQHCQAVTEAIVRRPGSSPAWVLAGTVYQQELTSIAQEYPDRVSNGSQHVRVIGRVVAEEALRRRPTSLPVSPLEPGRPLVENGPFSNWRRFPPERFDPHPVELGFSVKDIRTKVRCGADQILGWFPSRESSTF